jgi:hypothetical protein
MITAPQSAALTAGAVRCAPVVTEGRARADMAPDSLVLVDADKMRCMRHGPTLAPIVR